MIEVVEVKNKKQAHQFVQFPLNLYKNNPYFVPPLYGDEMALFKKHTCYDDQAEAVYFLAYKDNKVVGRISGILQYAANKKYNQKRVRFTRFDAINDQEVANALFDKVAAWAKEKNMNELVGPLGFSDLEREGLLVDGFDQLSTFEEQYNYPYYQQLIENYGFTKEVGWVERRLFAPDTFDDKFDRVAERSLKRYNLHLGKAKNVNEFIKKYADPLFDILDITYNEIYQTVPFTDKMKKSLISGFRLMLDLKYVHIILDENEKPVGFGLAFPAFGEALQKSGGRLTPAAIVRLLKAIKHPKGIDLGLVGVLPQYKLMGVATSIFKFLYDGFRDGSIKYAETNLNLEDNSAIQNQWKTFKGDIHKRRNCYNKMI